MKKSILIFCAAGLFSVMACDNNNNRNRDTHGGDTTTNNNNRDIRESDGRSGTDNGFGKHDRDANRQDNYSDSRAYDETNSSGNNDNLTSRGNTGSTSDANQSYGTNSGELPPEIRNKFENNETFKDMKIDQSRSYERNGKTYYEITFEKTDGNDLNRENTTTGDSRNRPINARTN